MSKNILSLWQINESESVLVEGFDDSLDDSLKIRLNETGFLAGETITCTKRLPIKGPSVYQVADGQYCLEKEVAEKIFIKRQS